MQITNYGSAWAQQFTEQEKPTPKVVKTTSSPIISVKRKRLTLPSLESQSPKK